MYLFPGRAKGRLSRVVENVPCPCFTREDPSEIPFLVCGVTGGIFPWSFTASAFGLPQWPWKTLVLPLEERDFSAKDVNDFDVRTFKKYANTIVFVNRTSLPVHISCFPTWSKRRNVRSLGLTGGAAGVEAGVTGEVEITTNYHQGYAAVDDPCLYPGAYEKINIPKGMVREMSVVFGVETADGSNIEYKRMKNVKGGQQVDVLEAFANKKAQVYTPDQSAVKRRPCG